MTRFFADFAINPDWLKYGFIGFAAVLALVAATIYQTSRKKSLPMLISYLVFALILGAMGLISPMIHDAHEDIARQKERYESAQKISALQDKLTYARRSILALTDIKQGTLQNIRADNESLEQAKDTAIQKAVKELELIDDKIIEALHDSEDVKGQVAGKP
jgi:hypothetical protein